MTSLQQKKVFDMLIFNKIIEWQRFRAANLGESNWGFVPTMGALHKGHMSLVDRSRQDNNKTVVSIFLNPTQFNDPKDLSGYPKTIEKDTAMLKAAGVDALLLPDSEQVYPDNYHIKIIESEFSQMLCGASRPGHFNGVLTVVMKLLNIARAQFAYFGEKDYQQYLLIKAMVEALFLQTKIISSPTIRESDGLAISSRNVRLTDEERALAPCFYEILTQNTSMETRTAQLVSNGFKIDYLEELNSRRYGAVFLGKVRLIDNVAI